MGFKFTFKAMVTSLLIIYTFQAQSQILIDDFSTDQPLIFAVGAGSRTSSFATTAGGDVLGGERDLEIVVDAGSVVSAEVGSGQLLFSVAATSTGTASIFWDGPDGLPAASDFDYVGLGGVDLTSLGLLNGISFVVDESDQTATVVITVATDAANLSNVTIPIPVIASNSAQKYFVPFSDFTAAIGTGADFTNVGAISMSIVGTEVDARILNVQAESGLSATLTDALLIDNDFDAVASPGDTIRYTATISNPDDAFDASAISIAYGQTNMPMGTSLVVGSVTTSQGSVLQGNSAGNTSVLIDFGTITDNSSVTVTYDVLIDSPLTTTISNLSSQGLVTDSVFYSIMTDDPDNGTGNLDATVTAITKTTVTGRVFVDDDGDGLDDPGETNGFSGVTVDIYVDNPPMLTFDGSDQLLADTVTMGAGGDFIGVSIPNYSQLIIDVTDTGNVLNGATVTGLGETIFSNGVTGGSRFVAFGYQLTNASIGDFIWNDLNANGIQDGGEPGIDGVTLDLYRDNNSNGIIDLGDTVVTSETTIVGGAYDFTGLAAGDYLVQVTDNLSALIHFGLTGGSNPVAVSLANGQDFNDADFGYQQQDASIGDFIWNDLDGDGVQDAGEPSIDSVTMDLINDANGNGVIDAGEMVIATTSTQVAGFGYTFDQLATGNYLVNVTDTFNLLSGFTLTGGSNPVAVSLAAGQTFNDADFGYQQQDASIGDFVWNDLNGDGVQDAGEPGLAGITVYLDLNGNNILDGGEPNSTSDAAGAYDLAGLSTGNYTVRVDIGTLPTDFFLNANDNFMVNLAAGEDFNDADFSIREFSASIGDLVWNDLNGDGIRDAGEPGLSGVRVFIDDNLDGVLDINTEPFDTTMADGSYELGSLAAETYSVRVDETTLPANFIITSSTTSPIVVTVAVGENNDLIDFGYQQQDASIGDFVWNDLNGDGVQDGGEPGLSGVTVFLDLNSNGTLDGGEPSEVSDASGAYDFTNLATGSYDVTIDTATVTSGFVLKGGTNPVVVNLAAGEDFNNADFGYQQQDASIGDFVWSDSDGDGIQDGGEPGLSGVTVYLDLNSNGVLDGGEPSEMTDGSGAYDFTDVATGTYDVRVDESTVPSGSTLTGGTNPAMVNLAAGEDFNDADFGYQPANGSIGDVVFNDRNGNGIQDAGEPGVFGASVYIDENNNGALDAGEPNATSNGVGAYDITGIAAGTYTVRIDASSIPDGYQQVLVGGNDFFNVTLAAGEDFNDADFVLNSSVEILINDVSLNEGDSGTSAFVFDVSLSEFASFTITVDYEVVAGTATAGNDFTVSSGTLTFNTTFGSGVNTQNITVDVMGDDIFEEDQTFNVVLSNPVDATLSTSGPGTGLGTIVNDDAQPEISINDSSVLEGNTGSTATMTFDVTLSGQSELPISVEYVTNEVDATADVDYTTSGGTVNFAALATTETINIAVTGDDIDESNETFTVDLSNASNATITDGSGIGTITDDEGEPTVSINDVNVVEGDEGNTQVELTVSLSNETSAIVEVEYQTVAGTAESDIDFVVATGTVSIPAKQLTNNIMLDVVGDFDIEEDEQFSVILTSTSNASISDGTGVVTITDDDEGADLSIALSVTPDNPQLLDTLTYVLTVTNNGPEMALDTNTTLNITDRVDFIGAMSDAGTCSHNNGLVNCDLGDLNNGQVVEIIVTAQVVTVGNITAVANVSSETSDDVNTSNNSSTFGSQTSAIMIPVLNTYGLLILALFMVFFVKRRPLIE